MAMISVEIEDLVKDQVVRAHGGGSGNVWLVHVVNEATDAEKVAVFSNIDDACAWVISLGDDWSATMGDLVVDEPDYNTSHREHLH